MSTILPTTVRDSASRKAAAASESGIRAAMRGVSAPSASSVNIWVRSSLRRAWKAVLLRWPTQKLRTGLGLAVQHCVLVPEHQELGILGPSGRASTIRLPSRQRTTR